jgi:molybdopterin-containing oxidoreductase family iron-sulfur binding subunit
MSKLNGTPGYIPRLLEKRQGRDLWRGLEQLADTEEFRKFLEAEFPALAIATNEVSRRGFLHLMGASMMLAGLAGCDQAPPDIIPYIKQPENLVPGVPRFYATAVTFQGYAQPILGETHEGRPTKLEGNPDHPASLGSTDSFTQAAVLQLYDPDRSQTPRYMGRPTGWEQIQTTITELRARAENNKGNSIRLLTGAVTSPTLLRQIDEFIASVPNARWHAFEPIGYGYRSEATRRAFSRPLDVQLRLDEATCIVSVDDDFLGPGPAQVFYARAWAKRKIETRHADKGLRLHVAESTPSLTGAAATTRLAINPSAISGAVFAIARELGIDVSSPQAALTENERSWIANVANELKDASGHCILTVGPYQSPDIQAIGFLINERLGNTGNTIVFTEPVAVLPPDGERSLQILTEDMKAGRVDTLIVLDSNPSYTAPRNFDFAAASQQVPLRIHAGFYYDETAAQCHWHLPLSHILESWSDARAVEGTTTIIQPLLRPLYDTRTQHEILSILAGELSPSGLRLIQQTWKKTWSLTDADFSTRWKQTLTDGAINSTTATAVRTSVHVDHIHSPPNRSENSVEVVIRADPTIWDGRFANHGWLQELPKPLLQVTWDNVISISPSFARELHVANGDHVSLNNSDTEISGPVWILPGQAERTFTVYLGYGRSHAGKIGNAIGYDAYPLVTSDSPFLTTASIAKVEGHTNLATTQYHSTMEGHDFVRSVARNAMNHPIEPDQSQPTLYSGWNYDDPSWGMVIDLDLCIGCNACIIACQAENNIPIVGKEQVAMGREMQWLRVDRYYEGSEDNPDTHFQPVPCMHCEQAPCEMGCPVGATVHGADGLNEMIYNRCIGTRTCSSYCPYKVRRFNWYDYTEELAPSTQAQFNPDVTVRVRGVMEKCTYCVQRISAARITAEKQQRPLRDGNVVTACQAVCPAQAIVFGNIKDQASAVSEAKRDPRNYSLLKEENTRPRTTYLAEIDDSEGDPHDD